MKLYIKNMVCSRCKETVKSALDTLRIKYDTIRIGEVTVRERLSAEQRLALSAALLSDGFELIDEQKYELIDKLKKSIKDLVQYSDEDLKTSFTDYISLNVNDNFISLNKLFAEIEGVTIDKYIIKRKIEKVKEMLVYEDLNLDQIAVKMHFTSAAALTRHFRRETGLTPDYFRRLRHNRNMIPLFN